MTEPGSWSEFERMEQRKAQDEQLIREWERANGSEHVRHVRNFVEHVRRDIGVNGVIGQVDIKPVKGGIEVVAGYRMESDPVDGLPTLRPSVSSPDSSRPDCAGAGACGVGEVSTPLIKHVEPLSDLVFPGGAATQPDWNGPGGAGAVADVADVEGQQASATGWSGPQT
ncbi:hypothetical protein [Saccharopolyspora shandongensis]|uniref:hypothetical protein n=1 Tax=Saccharopolyspora shandongensis TaxID=418495 RepID=UPI0033DDE086